MSYIKHFLIFGLGGVLTAFCASRILPFSDPAIIFSIGVLTMVTMFFILWLSDETSGLLVISIPYFFSTSVGAAIGCILNRVFVRKT
jgi:predicted MFS family arabinose efflux permease